jgi:DNA-binding response OmpR family regulator
MNTPADGQRPSPAGLLVVDGDPGTRGLLRDFLAGAGFESQEAGDLETALAHVAGARPAAVVLHDRIPGAQGVELLELLRQRHPDIPVVFIASEGVAARGGAGRFAGTAYVGKPFRMSELLATVVRTVHFSPPLSRPGRGGRRALRSGRAGSAERPDGAALPEERSA